MRSEVFKVFWYICKFFSQSFHKDWSHHSSFILRTFTRNKDFSSFPFQILHKECSFQCFLLHLYFCFQSFGEDQSFQFSFKSFEDDLRFQSFLYLYFLFQSFIRTTIFIIVKAFARSRVFTVFWCTCIFLFKYLIKVMPCTSRLVCFIWSEEMPFSKQEKCFLFHFKSFFLSRNVKYFVLFFPLTALLLEI